MSGDVRGGGLCPACALARLPPITLTPGEAATLIASLVAVGPYTSATARTALDKLLSALVPSRQRPAASARTAGEPASFSA